MRNTPIKHFQRRKKKSRVTPRSPRCQKVPEWIRGVHQLRATSFPLSISPCASDSRRAQNQGNLASSIGLKSSRTLSLPFMGSDRRCVNQVIRFSLPRISKNLQHSAHACAWISLRHGQTRQKFALILNIDSVLSNAELFDVFHPSGCPSLMRGDASRKSPGPAGGNLMASGGNPGAFPVAFAQPIFRKSRRRREFHLFQALVPAESGNPPGREETAPCW